MAEPLNWRWPTRPVAYSEPAIRCGSCNQTMCKIDGGIAACANGRCERHGIRYKYPKQVFELEPA